MAATKKAVPEELPDSLAADYRKPEDLVGENGPLKQLAEPSAGKAPEAGMAGHPGRGKNGPAENFAGNTRNGKSGKTLKGGFGELPAGIPRDRRGTSEPQLTPEHRARRAGFDDKILPLYARGTTVREIRGHPEETYGAGVSPTPIPSVTDAVFEEVKAWQPRPPDALYPVAHLGRTHVEARGGTVRVKAVYPATGINPAGEKEVPGPRVAQAEGAEFWLRAVAGPKNRGVQGIPIAGAEGLEGFPEAIETICPHAAVRPCIARVARDSLNCVSWKMRAGAAAGPERIYTSTTVDGAGQRPGGFGGKRGDSHLPTSRSWRRNRPRIIPFSDYPPEIGKVIYTTNAIGSANVGSGKITENRGPFPGGGALLKPFYPAPRNIGRKWAMPVRGRKAAPNRFAIQFEDRMTSL